MPPAKLNTTAGTSNAPPTAISHPVRGSPRLRRVRTTSATSATSEKPSSHPAWSPSPFWSSRNRPVGPPNIVPPKPPPTPPPAGPPD